MTFCFFILKHQLQVILCLKFSLHDFVYFCEPPPALYERGFILSFEDFLKNFGKFRQIQSKILIKQTFFYSFICFQSFFLNFTQHFFTIFLFEESLTPLFINANCRLGKKPSKFLDRAREETRPLSYSWWFCSCWSVG